ncbi:hypothetical protein [Streptomyces sp. NPDC055709]
MPSESELAGWKKNSSHRKHGRPDGSRKLNRVGRRHQLAGELIRQVSWLGRCRTPRVAWIVRHVADAGWTATEIRAWLHLRGEADVVRRPTGLLATLLAGAETALDTPAKRAWAVEHWRDSRVAAARRHQEWTTAACGPSSHTVRRTVREALMSPAGRFPAPAADTRPVGPDVTALSPSDIRTLRDTALGEFMRGETTLIRAGLEAWGRGPTEHVYGPGLVERAARLAGATTLIVLGGRKENHRE